MANTVHFITPHESGLPRLIVRDDRGIPIVEHDLPSTVTEPENVDDDLRTAGWVRSADWTGVDDGWVAPVVAAGDMA